MRIIRISEWLLLKVHYRGECCTGCTDVWFYNSFSTSTSSSTNTCCPVADTVPELPSQPDPAPEIETPLPDSEAGQIKSISIVRPTDGEVITDPSIDVEGTVDGYVGSLGQYTVTLRRGDDIVGTSESSSSSWSIDKGSDWSEGEQSVVAVLEDVEEGYRHNRRTKIYY